MGCLGINVIGLKLFHLLFRSPRDQYMTRAACACNRWGARAFLLIAWIMRIRLIVEYEGPSPIPECLVVSNHVSIMDVPVVPGALVSHGLDNLRWAVKKAFRKYPIMGWCAEEIGNPFLGRDKDPRDLEAMRACGAMLRRQGGSALLFVEGTRLVTVDPTSRYRNVGEPRIGGYAILRETIPERPVLTVAIKYPEAVRNGKGKKLAQTILFYGVTVRVSLRLYPAEAINAMTAAESLHLIWKDVDDALSNEP